MERVTRAVDTKAHGNYGRSVAGFKVDDRSVNRAMKKHAK